MLSTIAGCGKMLKQWLDVLKHSHPSYQKNIPYPSSMNIGKLGSGSDLMPDTCNGARETRRLIVDQDHEAVEAFQKDNSDEICVLEVDCWNHLRNVWLEGMTKDLSVSLEKN